MISDPVQSWSSTWTWTWTWVFVTDLPRVRHRTTVTDSSALGSEVRVPEAAAARPKQEVTSSNGSVTFVHDMFTVYTMVQWRRSRVLFPDRGVSVSADYH